MKKAEVLVEKIWGGRSLAKIFNKKLPKGKLIGECWSFCKKNNPIVIKLIDVKKPLSVQVHPYGKNGKSELWYILESGEKTRVLGGITLDEYKVRKGDWVYLPGGTVHTILPPAVLLEVSQSRLVTYRLYDWGRGSRPLDIENGIKNIKINSKPKFYRDINSFKCSYFKIKKLKLEKGEVVKSKGVCFVLDGSVKTGNVIIDKGNARLVNKEIIALSKAVVFLVS
jgi:mannose-6-phosphate isomerase